MRHRGAKAKADREIVKRLCAWFDASARVLPWRDVGTNGQRDPYTSLVSEFMLQQTQVSRVLEKFGSFMTRFPTVEALARAEVGDVLAEWSGLGYYRRARHLHGAARTVVGEFGGRVPSDIDDLRRLPGVGQYTAGAIASMVFGKPEPLVDGNVARVLLRVEGKKLDAKAGMAWAWERAAELVEGCDAPGAFNEGLMELGALVCTPASPRCGECPLSKLCEAQRLGLQGEIPRPKKRPERGAVVHSSVLVRDGRGRILVERRGETGLWAGMWQAPTVEKRAAGRALAGWLGLEGRPRRLGGFVHHTTHRAVEFVVWDGGVGAIEPGNRRWVSPKELSRLAMGNAQKRVLGMAAVPISS